MAYEKYKKIKTREQFFNEWDDVSIKSLPKDMKEYIYQKYLTKCKVLQRDKFKCQNINCKTPKSPLTIHRVRFGKNLKNKGEYKKRNSVTNCKTCHQGYHRGKKALTFSNTSNLPAHIRGHTFKIDKPEKIDWKKIKAEARKVRQEIKLRLSERIKELPPEKRRWFELTLKEIAILMAWITKPYTEFDEDDDD